ncbi:hypothetical protein [Nakamurella sp. PAMC28650]|uniref:hypothetical protein n=1 Tax=Nakamurella sp. PAMC28650 TaxID=2762325 RepID=UPI00164CEE4B|nr:hypothetical protein [Nakamurella sp. PAMC28650]QNK82570.1 hypothetical protein H7F38_07650 [Nakamurella sp. PAMC28650]
MSGLFQAEGIVQSVKTLVDGTIKLDVAVQEVSPPEMALLFGLARKPGWILVKPNEITAEDIPIVEADFDMGETKSPGQRLRGVLFVVWQTKTSQKQPFEVYYRAQLDRIIDRFKQELD